MTSRDEMVKLRERVRCAKGPDREIDRNLALLFGAVNWPNFSSSIDAALALCERALPGWDWNISRDDSRNYAHLVEP